MNPGRYLRNVGFSHWSHFYHKINGMFYIGYYVRGSRNRLCIGFSRPRFFACICLLPITTSGDLQPCYNKIKVTADRSLRRNINARSQSSFFWKSFSNNRIVAKALALGTLKAGSKGWDWSLGSIQDP